MRPDKHRRRAKQERNACKKRITTLNRRQGMRCGNEMETETSRPVARFESGVIYNFLFINLYRTL